MEPLLAANQVARLLGIEVETLGSWRRKGYGPRWYRIGKKIKYVHADLKSWMSQQASGGAGEHLTAEQHGSEVSR